MNSKAIFVFILFLGILLFARTYFYFASIPHYKSGDFIAISLTLFVDPREVSSGQSFSFRLPSGRYVFVTAPFTPKLSFGDQINVSGKLSELKNGENSYLVLKQPQISVKPEGKSPILAASGAFRYKIARFYNSYLPQTSASLLLGIVFGIKENMPADFQDLLKNAGVTHVIAASGMNISLIAGFFAVAFSKLFNRRLALVLTVIMIALYAVLSGLEPSIVRAAIMGTIAYSAQLLGRQNSSIFTLLITAFIMLFIDPSLTSDVGFQLSFVSTMGILILNPFFAERVGRFSLVKILGADFLTTVSAQISTFPIILGTFGSFFFLSFIANVLVLWTIPLLMVLGALGGLVGIVFEPAGSIVLYLAYPFLAYFETVVRYFGSFSPSINITTLPIQITVGYYLLLGALIVKLKTR